MSVHLSGFEKMVKAAVESAIGKTLRNKDLIAVSLGRQASYIKNPAPEGEHYIEVKVSGQTVFVNYSLK